MEGGDARVGEWRVEWGRVEWVWILKKGNRWRGKSEGKGSEGIKRGKEEMEERVGSVGVGSGGEGRGEREV